MRDRGSSGLHNTGIHSIDAEESAIESAAPHSFSRTPQESAAASLPLNGEPPLVSISMITYRHESFIEEALRGVLNQQTDFPFELVVSSDNSPDGTDEIIRSVLASHPMASRVRYIRHPRTLGMIHNGLDNLRHCRGEWIALCEGDDFWTDPSKLQQQINRLRQNPSCDLSFHPCRIFHGSTPTRLLFGYQGTSARIIPTIEFIEGGCDFCPTAAVIFRRTILDRLPDFYLEVPVGDYFIKLLACLRGGALYQPEPRAVYRRNIRVSWTAATQSLPERGRFFEEFTRSLSRLSASLEPRLQKAIHHEIERQYRDFAYHCLKDGNQIRYRWAFARLQALLRPNRMMWTLHQLGVLTRSPALFVLFKRLLLEIPSPARRALKRAIQKMAELRLPSMCSTQIVQRAHSQSAAISH